MGNKRGHKGGHRRFTNPQEVELRKEKEEREREWRRQRGELESDEEDEENSNEEESSGDEKNVRKSAGIRRSLNHQKKKDEEKDDEESSDEEPLIEICNPNRMPQKAKKNVTLDDKVILSRKEKEEIEKQKAKEHYQKLTAEGKTKEAQDDLARLALIRQKREEAARKREEITKKTNGTASTSKTASKKKSLK